LFSHRQFLRVRYRCLVVCGLLRVRVGRRNVSRSRSSYKPEIFAFERRWLNEFHTYIAKISLCAIRIKKLGWSLLGSAVKVTKMRGDFVWHFHGAEDELFLVLPGNRLMKLRHGDLLVNKGEFIVAPRAVEHR
jgi:mannose-6-phosphate isomerase-like protein (cupin superfamily)